MRSMDEACRSRQTTAKEGSRHLSEQNGGDQPHVGDVVNPYDLLSVEIQV